MSKGSPNSEFVEEKRKLLYWIAQWNKEGNNSENANLDVPELTVLLQAIGFRLEAFEKAVAENISNISEIHSVRIELICTKSGMRSTLIKETPDCKCPSDEESAEGQFWSVTGCGPSTQNNTHSSNSSLLPTIGPSKVKIVSHLMAKIFTIINGTDTNNHSEKLFQNVCTSPLTRHRSLDTLKSSANVNMFPALRLKRRPSWEVDPKTSPPRGSSSMTSLSKSVSQISLDSANTSVVVKNLEAIKKLVNETLEVAGTTSATFSKSSVPKKRVSDIKPTEGPSVWDLVQPHTPTQQQNKTPRRKVTPRRLLGSSGEKKGFIASSRISTLKNKASVRTTSPRTDILKPKTKLIKNADVAGKRTESSIRSKIATGLGAKPKVPPHVVKEGKAGASGIAKFKTFGRLSSAATTIKKK